MLTILRLAFHLVQYHKLAPITCPVRFISDSDSLLKRIEAARKLTIVRPRRALYSDADIEMGILATLTAMNLNITFVHVHSHQDGPKSHDAILNVPMIAVMFWQQSISNSAPRFETKYHSFRLAEFNSPSMTQRSHTISPHTSEGLAMSLQAAHTFATGINGATPRLL